MWITQLVVSLLALPLASCQSGSPSDVRLPPTITTGPDKGRYYRAEKKFTLECRARGVPELTYEWTRNGMNLNLNGHNVHREIDGTITIDPTTSLDAGFYQCIARNQYGTALSNTSFMQMAVLDSPGNEQVTKIVTEGEPFCIEAHPMKSNPIPGKKWEKADGTVDKYPERLSWTKRMQMDETGNLCFAYAKPEDDLNGRIYKISEFNAEVDQAAGGSYTNVTVNRVQGGAKPFAPTLGFSSQHQTVVVEGQEVTLWCFFFGNPEPDLAWSGPRNTLPVERIEYPSDAFKSRMQLRDIRPSDEGDYICTGSNTMGTNTHTMQMRVEAEPRFLSRDDQPHDTNVTDGATLTFKCYTYAKPEASVVWLWNGLPLDLNQLPRRYRVSNDKKSLTIENLCRDCTDRPESISNSDLGVIQCNASNIHGYAFGAGYVNVLLKTSVVFIGEKEVSVDMNEGKEFTWECTVTSDPSTLTWVKWWKETEDSDLLVYDESPALILRNGTLIMHIVPNKTHGWEKYQGKYRCDGGNGYSNESVYAELRLLNYVPPGQVASEIKTYWWIILLILLLLLLILLICICCCYLRRNRGDKYDVDEKERENGNDPEKELVNNGFHDYQRPEGQNLKGSRGSLGSNEKLNSDDEASLLEYGEDPGKFTEDGSFVGAYKTPI